MILKAVHLAVAHSFSNNCYVFMLKFASLKSSDELAGC